MIPFSYDPNWLSVALLLSMGVSLVLAVLPARCRAENHLLHWCILAIPWIVILNFLIRSRLFHWGLFVKGGDFQEAGFSFSLDIIHFGECGISLMWVGLFVGISWIRACGLRFAAKAIPHIVAGCVLFSFYLPEATKMGLMAHSEGPTSDEDVLTWMNSLLISSYWMAIVASYCLLVCVVVIMISSIRKGRQSLPPEPRL